MSIIYMWDLDWNGGYKDIPNIKLMKLSSFYKQRGDSVHFIADELELMSSYDKLFIFKEKSNSKYPDFDLIEDSRTNLVGKGLKQFGSKNISEVVACCRPDYGLYSGNKYCKFNLIMFYLGRRRVVKQQDFHNTYKSRLKKNLVVDGYFWKAEDQEIIQCLEMLTKEKNISFLYEISLKKILENKTIQELFLSQNFTMQSDFYYEPISCKTRAEIDAYIDLINRLNKLTSSFVGTLVFNAINIGKEYEDVELVLYFITQCKKNKIKCNIQINEISHYSWIMTEFSNWMKKVPDYSLVEYLTSDVSYRKGYDWSEAFNNSLNWNSKKMNLFVKLWTDTKFIENYGLIVNDKENNILSAIDQERIKKYIIERKK